MSALQKRVRITLEDGRVFSLSAHAVAHDRAKFYAAKDKETTYGEEYEFTLGDDYQLKDWLFGNMNWHEMDPKLERHDLQPLNKAVVLRVDVVIPPEEPNAN